MVTGETGAGKSTMLQIISGLYDVQHGTLSYQDLPKGNIDLTTLRNAIGDCLSQEQLFNGTILENIAMGRKEANFDNVKWAIEKVGLTEFLRRQPKGFETMLDPKGSRLPGSIVQRLLIARSVADRPKLLVLEDSFEKLRPEEARPIIDFLTDKSNGWTLVAVSVNPYLAERVDRVVWMDKGKVTKEGDFYSMKDYIIR
jgi:ABC-type bacteriocin/lantibiotic exporter with double-glycine peptidase domain